MPRATSATTAPTTPPAIAPVLLFEDFEAAVEVVPVCSEVLFDDSELEEVVVELVDDGGICTP